MANCPIERRKRLTFSSLNILTGETGKERVEIVTESCGTPLFGKAAERGHCDSCEKGWEVEGSKITAAGWAKLGRKGV